MKINNATSATILSMFIGTAIIMTFLGEDTWWIFVMLGILLAIPPMFYDWEGEREDERN